MCVAESRPPDQWLLTSMFALVLTEAQMLSGKETYYQRDLSSCLPLSLPSSLPLFLTFFLSLSILLPLPISFYLTICGSSLILHLSLSPSLSFSPCLPPIFINPPFSLSPSPSLIFINPPYLSPLSLSLRLSVPRGETVSQTVKQNNLLSEESRWEWK